MLAGDGSAVFVPALGLREPCDNLEERSVRASRNLLASLVLNGMRHIYRVKIRAIQCRRLRPRGGLKFAGGNGHRGDSQIL
jgi:hypothetical protein